MASQSARSPWRKAKNSGTAARTSALKKPAGKQKKPCIATGGDRAAMQITLVTSPYAALDTEALVTYVFEEADPVQGRVVEIDQAVSGLLGKLSKSGELTGKTLEFTLLHAPSGLKAARLLLVGAGKREQCNGATLRKLTGAALRYLKSKSVKQIAFLVRENDASEESAQVIAEGALAANFESDKYKTEKKNGKSFDSVLLAGYTDV